MTGQGLGKDGLIHTGNNSGYQAINLVYLFGAKIIFLLGYDMQRTDGKSHWHGDHPGNLNRHSNYPKWIENFQKLASDLKEEGVKVVNATRKTALNCFPKQKLEEIL